MLTSQTRKRLGLGYVRGTITRTHLTEPGRGRLCRLASSLPLSYTIHNMQRRESKLLTMYMYPCRRVVCAFSRWHSARAWGPFERRALSIKRPPTEARLPQSRASVARASGRAEAIEPEPIGTHTGGMWERIFFFFFFSFTVQHAARGSPRWPSDGRVKFFFCPSCHAMGDIYIRTRQPGHDCSGE
jgi:hypothetical protein